MARGSAVGGLLIRHTLPQVAPTNREVVALDRVRKSVDELAALLSVCFNHKQNSHKNYLLID